jgi:hypothetical protein
VEFQQQQARLEWPTSNEIILFKHVVLDHKYKKFRFGRQGFSEKTGVQMPPVLTALDPWTDVLPDDCELPNLIHCQLTRQAWYVFVPRLFQRIQISMYSRTSRATTSGAQI